MKTGVVLVFSATTNGGLAEHIFYQCRGLHEEGKQVCLLAPAGFLTGRKKNFEVRETLIGMPQVGNPSLVKKFRQALILCINYFKLALWILKLRPDFVLIDSYREYLSPLWAWSLRWSLSVAKSISVVNLHDPVRDYVVGPAWWHKWSVRTGYSYIDIGTIHSAVNDKADLPLSVETILVPVGVYDLPSSSLSRAEIRKKWNAAQEHSVFLSFGYIRDNKNIDLLIRAIKNMPQIFLVIAGTEQSKSDKSISYYRDLARNINVADRCYFHNDFIAEDEVGNYFKGADFIALTYSSSFHSQSGVLNLAAAARLPILASGADSPLTQSVSEYSLGLVVEPDSVSTIAQGMLKLTTEPIHADWDGYSLSAGWGRNILTILEAVSRRRDPRGKSR